jgi:hexosaminidase
MVAADRYSNSKFRFFVTPGRMLVVIAFIATFCGGFVAHRWRHAGDHIRVREWVIASQAAQLQNVDWLILGDSLVELASIPSMCGGSVFNSGVGGAGVDVALETLPGLAGIKARNIVIQIGVNDAARIHRTRPDEFAADYRRLVTEAEATGAKVFVSMIGPVAKGMDIGDVYYDPELIGRLNVEIRKIAVAGELSVVDFSKMAGADGYLPADETADGVHLKPNGYVIWRKTLEQSVCN